jgi:tripeptidyl-peptidase I
MMKTSLALSCLAALVAPSLAATIKSRSPYAVKGSHPVPPRWERVDRAHPDHPIELRIGLKQSQFDELERQLYQSKKPSDSGIALLTMQQSLIHPTKALAST